MGKHKRIEPNKKATSQNGVKSKGIKRRQHSQIARPPAPQHAKAKPASSKPPTVKLPFTKWDNILCVGEGDFSYAASLARNHHVGTVVATSFDTLEVLKQKYAYVDNTLNQLQCDIKHEKHSNDDWQGFSDAENGGLDPKQHQGKRTRRTSVFHGVDATALSKSKAISQHAPFNKIIFNFPHVGGISTDVNRQVRANQQLLVSFFKSATPLLANTSRPSKLNDSGSNPDIEYDSSGE